VTLVAKGAHDVEAATVGMAVGAIALLIYSAVAVPALRRFGALKGAAIALIAWFLVAGAGAWMLP
jgi:hypothetical protein